MLDWLRGDKNMLINVLAVSTTQVLKNGRPLTLQAGSVVGLDTSIGDTYSKRACRVVGQSVTVTVEVPEKEENDNAAPSNDVIDLATASRTELWAFSEENGIDLPPELKKRNASTEKVRAGVLAALQG